MTTIDHAGALAVGRPDALSSDRVAGRALQVARRTALGVLGDAEAAADIAQDVAITAVRGAGSRMPPPVRAAFFLPKVKPGDDDDDDRGPAARPDDDD